MPIEAVAKGWFASAYELSENGQPVATLVTPVFKRWVRIMVDGREYRYERQGFTSRRNVLYAGGDPIAVAERTNLFGRERLVVRHRDRELQLVRASAWRSDFELREGERLLGTITSSKLARRATVALSEELELVIRVFIFAVVLMLGRQRRAAAGS